MAILGLELQTSEFILSHNPALVFFSRREKTAEQEIKVLGLCLHTLTQAVGEKQAIVQIIPEYNKLKKKKEGCGEEAGVSGLMVYGGGANSASRIL